jgi:GNAT superfamily N-acetyltransferase
MCAGKQIPNRRDYTMTELSTRPSVMLDARVAAESPRLDIRPASSEDEVEVLIANFAQRDYFADRFSRQKCGHGVLLIAWWGDRPVGDAYVWLEEAEEPELRKYLRGVPLLTHVEVLESYRSRGIGTKLIAAAEAALTDAGKTRVALAVEIDNHGAMRLYGRLGYELWGRRDINCAAFDGGVEVCRVMVKDLP